MELQESAVVSRYQFWKQSSGEQPKESKENWDNLNKSSVDCNGCDGCGPND